MDGCTGLVMGDVTIVYVESLKNCIIFENVEVVCIYLFLAAYIQLSSRKMDFLVIAVLHLCLIDHY